MPESPKPIAPGIPLVILPLGDSITAGFMWGTAPENSYRLPLLQLLTSPTHGGKSADEVIYIGSKNDGDFENNAHDGWSGHMIHEVWNASDVLREDGGYAEQMPNVVLLHIGTNDCNNDPAKPGCEHSDSPRRLGVLIDQLFDKFGADGTVVLVAKLTQSGWPEPCARIDAFNEKVPDVVRAQSEGKGRRCVLADMRDIGRGQDTIDGLHPNEVGFDKMAQVWVEALREADGKGWIQRLPSWETCDKWFDGRRRGVGAAVGKE